MSRYAGLAELAAEVPADSPQVLAMTDKLQNVSLRSIIHAAEDGDVARLRNLLNTDAGCVHERTR